MQTPDPLTADYQNQWYQAWCTAFVEGGFLLSSALLAITVGVSPCGLVAGCIVWVRWALFAPCALTAACALAVNTPLRAVAAVTRWVPNGDGPPFRATRAAEAE